MDLKKVLEGGPWAFEQGMLVYKQISENEDPNEVLLNDFDMWVQVYDIPKGFISEAVLQSVGNYIGEYVTSDPANFHGTWKTFVRIRVKMSVLKPLKRRMRIKREGGNWSWIHFKYERLSSFCFVCGIIGHSERDCDVVYDNPGKEIERAYGPWLRAPGKNSKTPAGSRWLRNAENESRWKNGEGSSRPAPTGDGGGASFKGYGTVVTVNQGDVGKITVISKNQEGVDMGGRISNVTDLEGENQGVDNVIVDLKRRRTDSGSVRNDNGPDNMQTDGLEIVEQVKENKDSKNEMRVGSGDQAHLEL